MLLLASLLITDIQAATKSDHAPLTPSQQKDDDDWIDHMVAQRDLHEGKAQPATTEARNTVYVTGLYGGDGDDSAPTRTTTVQGRQPFRSEKQIREDLKIEIEQAEQKALREGFSYPMFTHSMFEQRVAQECGWQKQAEPKVVTTYTPTPYQAPQPQYQPQPASSQATPLYRKKDWCAGIP